MVEAGSPSVNAGEEVTDRVQVIGEAFVLKTVSPSTKDRSGQVYVDRSWEGQACLAFWAPEIHNEIQTDSTVKLDLTCTMWEQRTPYKRGSAAGFYANKDHLDDEVLVLLKPTRLEVDPAAVEQ